jgi:hypothetical protein
MRTCLAPQMPETQGGHRKCHTEECGNRRTAGDVSHRLRELTLSFFDAVCLINAQTVHVDFQMI